MNAATPLPRRPVAVLFDMDGTMLESERLLRDAWRQAAAEQQVAADDALWLGMVGLSESASQAWLHRHLPAATAAALRLRAHALYRRRAAGGLPVKPGLVDLLRALCAAGLPRAVVTSTAHARALERLQASGLLPWFAFVVGGDDVARPKPAADPYRLAARRLGVDPRRCLAIEDSITGVRAALAAGMDVVQVPDLVPPDAGQRALGQRVMASLAQVHAWLRPWLHGAG